MKILYIMAGCKVFGGTPKKTLDLINNSTNDSFVYFYDDKYAEHSYNFTDAGAKVFQGFYGKNILMHVYKLLKIIDSNQIDIIQTQFTFGEVLASLLKILRPKVKVIIAFVVPFSPKGFAKLLIKLIYRKVNIDRFLFISEYVKREKLKEFPALRKKSHVLVYNGTTKRKIGFEESPVLVSKSILAVSALLDWKNIELLIDAMSIINKNNKDIYLYIAGDGVHRKRLEDYIEKAGLESNVFLLGNQKNIGALLNSCDIFVHPSYAEGFGIAVPEAMLANKPIIVAKDGALPELIKHEIEGLVLEPFDIELWVKSILELLSNKQKAEFLARNSEAKAMKMFSIESYVGQMQKVYSSLVDTK
jgi:glycosyltransferase involved in cell wall biosynthesis